MRDAALKILEEPVYKTESDVNKEMDYVIGKLGFTHKQFEEIMKTPPRSHFEFQVNKMYGSLLDRTVLFSISLIKYLRKLFVKY